MNRSKIAISVLCRELRSFVQSQTPRHSPAHRARDDRHRRCQRPALAIDLGVEIFAPANLIPPTAPPTDLSPAWAAPPISPHPPGATTGAGWDVFPIDRFADTAAQEPRSPRRLICFAYRQIQICDFTPGSGLVILRSEQDARDAEGTLPKTHRPATVMANRDRLLDISLGLRFVAPANLTPPNAPPTFSLPSPPPNVGGASPSRRRKRADRISGPPDQLAPYAGVSG